MYCLQWLIPVLLIPKPINPALLYNHAMFIVLYLASFFLERKPCTVCSIVFVSTVFLVCYSCVGNCLFWQCPEIECQDDDCETWNESGSEICNYYAFMDVYSDRVVSSCIVPLNVKFKSILCCTLMDMNLIKYHLLT